MAGTDLIERATLDAILGWREKALALAEEARACHVATLAKIREATEIAQRVAPGHRAMHQLKDRVLDLHDKPERFTPTVRADLDRAIWPSILEHTGLAGLMDKAARDEFDQDLASDPPECTEENIRATFRQLRDDAHRIFRRGVVNVFRNLSREYRSHDGFKLGPRTIISYAVSGYGRDYHAFADADRIMHILDGVRVDAGWVSPLYAQMRASIKTEFRANRSGSGNFVVIPGEAETPYWRVRWFSNQNAHLWCLRPDLLRRANRLIAEHFEDALGASPDASGARKYHRSRPHHHEVVDFYPTPPAVVARMVEAADLRPGLEVLEPSAGDGAIVRGILDAGCTPDAFEIDEDRAETLREMLPPGAVVCMDFLRIQAEPEYDRILMNPPFGKGAGVQHVLHALRFLKPGGKLVAILGSGFEYRDDGPTRELRELLFAWGGSATLLPAGSFRASGTDVETLLVTIPRPSSHALALPAPAHSTTTEATAP